jgi:ubiquinone/menaquinone biosynthesis C-methylase UbiE
MFVCPDCKAVLEQNRCGVCKTEFQNNDGVPVLFSRDPRYSRAREFAQTYDAIYTAETNVWERVGRTSEFISYFSKMLGSFKPKRFLEIGCGEGFLLSAVQSSDKWAVDLSREAIRAAQKKTSARFCQALVERLPFPSDHFDVVTSVGVMEHFLDIDEALREVARVVKPGGHYVTLTHVKPPYLERVTSKVSEFLLPPRPIAFYRWLQARGNRQARNQSAAPKQPIQNALTRASGKKHLEANGFEVIDVMYLRRYPNLPLKGPFVVIYVARKPATKG